MHLHWTKAYANACKIKFCVEGGGEGGGGGEGEGGGGMLAPAEF